MNTRTTRFWQATSSAQSQCDRRASHHRKVDQNTRQSGKSLAA
ncbi:MAG: hypothetical protein ACYTXI_38475 [Nostoc sp.]